MTERRGQASTECNPSHLGHAVHYKPPGCRDEQVNRQNAEKVSEGRANLNWREKLEVPNQYAAYRPKCFEMLAHFENTPKCHLGLGQCSIESYLGNQRTSLHIKCRSKPVQRRESSRNALTKLCSP